MSARTALAPTRALLDVVVLAALAGIILTIWLVTAHGAWSYYTTPLAVRGYEHEHRFLRPSGEAGHLLGFAGTFFLVATLAYVARRRIRRLSRTGSVARWLEIHIFCGVFGPLLITFHTSFKFNGIVSVAYWSMVLVMVSGFVGRYLYVRIPKTIRGEEVTRAELEERAAEMQAELARMSSPDPQVVRAAAALAHEHAQLVRRISRLEATRRLFQLWHVFHRPLVWVMFVILAVHVSVAIYFGYMPFGA